jgi:hypothetical protein
MDARSSILWEMGVGMGLRKKDNIHARLCSAVRDVRTVVILRVIGPNGDVFQFSDNLQSGLPDLRGEFIKG